MPSSLPRSLVGFIRSSVPTYQAAEVLVFLAAHADRAFTPDEIVAGMLPVSVSPAAVREYVALFAATGLAVEADGKFVLRASTDELAQNIHELTRAYNEQPVTLIRAIYRIADSKIQSFADSFDLRKDQS